MFKKNVGSVDRVLRIMLGLALLAGFIFWPSEAGYRWWMLIGVVPLATAFMSSCPVYSLLGMSTCPMKKS
jgi:hypothetical protein